MNWDGGLLGLALGTNPDPGDNLIFDGNLRRTNNNNYANGTAFGDISFAAGAGAFTLTGNSVTLSGSVTNNSANTQTINLPFILPGIRTFNAASADLVVNGTLSGSGGLNKTGSNMLTLSGTNIYVGATSVNAGTLRINGNHSLATGTVTVGPSGTLGGTGIIGGDTVINGGTHAPGNSPGVLTHLGNVTYNGGSKVQWELTQNSSSTALQTGTSFYFDQIVVEGDLNFAGATTMNLTFNASSTVDWSNSLWDLNSTQDWLVYEVGGTTSNFGNLTLSDSSTWLDSTGQSFSSAIGGDLPGSAQFYLYQSSGNIYLRYEAIPEPTGLSVLALFLGVMALISRPRRWLD